MNTPSLSLRKHIREILYEFLTEVKEPIFFIRFSQKKGMFVLYKRFFGYDRFGNKNEQIVAVQDLSANPEEAQKIAKEITGHDLFAKLPGEVKSIDRGKVILPFKYVRGKKIEEIPLDTLIRLMFQTKWMTFVRKDHYRLAIYEYLTQDLPSKTAEYLSERVKKMSTNALISQYNEYLENEKSPGAEHIVFARIFMPLLKKELENRSVQI